MVLVETLQTVDHTIDLVIGDGFLQKAKEAGVDDGRASTRLSNGYLLSNQPLLRPPTSPSAHVTIHIDPQLTPQFFQVRSAITVD